jgi:Holliday junction resolvase RusA-like endonuclease
MDSIRITIKQEPVAKGRAKTAFIHGVVRTYTPKKTRDAQDFIKARLMRHKDKMFGEHVPVKLVCTFYRTKSKWLPRSEDLPVRKGDLDNYVKCLTDSMNLCLLKDDSQITQIIAKKRWSTKSYGYITVKMTKDKLSNEDNE